VAEAAAVEGEVGVCPLAGTVAEVAGTAAAAVAGEGAEMAGEGAVAGEMAEKAGEMAGVGRGLGWERRTRRSCAATCMTA